MAKKRNLLEEQTIEIGFLGCKQAILEGSNPTQTEKKIKMSKMKEPNIGEMVRIGLII